MSLTRAVQMIGQDHVDPAWKRSLRAVAGLVILAAAPGLDCQRRPEAPGGCPGSPPFIWREDQRGANPRRRRPARQEIGIRAADLDRAARMDGYGIDHPAAIWSDAPAPAYPAQLAAGLLRATLSRNRPRRSRSPIWQNRPAASRPRRQRTKGEVVMAEPAAFCTGAEYLPQMKTKPHHLTPTRARLPGLATGQRPTRPAAQKPRPKGHRSLS